MPPPPPGTSTEAAPSLPQQQGLAYPPPAAPTTEDLHVLEARKKLLRALDAKISQQDDATALGALETAAKIVNNILQNPADPKFRRLRSNNALVSKKLLRVPGGQDLLLSLGFRTKVVEFEEMWLVEEGPILHRILAEATVALERYTGLTREKLERSAKQRKERLANLNEDRARTLAAIEEDKAARKERSHPAAPTLS